MVPFYKYVLAWVPMVFIAITNGIIREAIFGKSLSKLRAHQLSTLTGIIFFGAYIWGISEVLPFASAGIAWIVGVVWLIMTVAFEFLFGHYVMHHTWAHLFEDYNIFAGRLWSLVLLWVTIAPYIFYLIS